MQERPEAASTPAAQRNSTYAGAGRRAQTRPARGPARACTSETARCRVSCHHQSALGASTRPTSAPSAGRRATWPRLRAAATFGPSGVGRPEWSKQLTVCSHRKATAVQHITHAGHGAAAAGANWSPTRRADRACRWRGGVQAGAASAAAAVPHEPALLVVPDVAAHLREAAALGPCWRPAARPLKAAAALSPPPAHGFPLLLQARRVGTVGKRRVLAAATSLLSTAQPTEQSLAASSTLTGKCIRLQVSRSAQPGCRRKRRPRRRARPG